jgi:hypothetical protein
MFPKIGSETPLNLALEMKKSPCDRRVSYPVPVKLPTRFAGISTRSLGRRLAKAMDNPIIGKNHYL